MALPAKQERAAPLTLYYEGFNSSTLAMSQAPSRAQRVGQVEVPEWVTGLARPRTNMGRSHTLDPHPRSGFAMGRPKVSLRDVQAAQGSDYDKALYRDFVPGRYHGTHEPFPPRPAPVAALATSRSEPPRRMGGLCTPSDAASSSELVGRGSKGAGGGGGARAPSGGGWRADSSRLANQGLLFLEGRLPAVRRDPNSPEAYLRAYRETMRHGGSFADYGVVQPEVTVHMAKDGWAPYDSPLMDRSMGRLSQAGVQGIGGTKAPYPTAAEDRVWHGGHGVRMREARHTKHKQLLKAATGRTPLYWLQGSSSRGRGGQ